MSDNDIGHKLDSIDWGITFLCIFFMFEGCDTTKIRRHLESIDKKLDAIAVNTNQVSVVTQ